MNLKSFTKYLVFFCYLLPSTFFKVSCDNGFDIYENKQKAAEAETKQPIANLTVEPDTALSIIISATDTAVQPDVLTDTAAIEQESSINDFLIPIGSFAIFPTATSMSAFGNMIFSERPLNKLTIAVSLLCSALSILPFRFLKQGRISIIVAATNLLSIITFLIICAIYQITLLWGAWVLQAVIALNFYLSFSTNRLNNAHPK